MVLFLRNPASHFRRFLLKLPGSSRHAPHSLAFLNSAQFLGVLNDNIFKLAIVFMLIEAQGAGRASSILSAAGATFVAPFLLFSSAAGILADRFSKQRLLMLMKLAEITIMALAMVAFAYKSERSSFALLFLLSTHSALFGPSKYGIIPELVPAESVSKANGLITSFTYLAIIIGTFLAAFLTDITGHRFVLVIGFCLIIAFGGLLSTFGIKRTHPQRSQKKINIFFVREIYKTLVFSRSIKHLFMAILGASYFLFIGAYMQLNIIPFAIQSLHLSDVAGGYLFLSTALGIAFGAILAGKLCKKNVELGLSCIAGLAISLLLVLLSLFSKSLSISICLLVLVGISGGVFIVPFESFIQIASPKEKRGQVIAAANFLSFSGVLIASFILYVFSELLGLSSAEGFAIIGIITFIVSCLFIMRLSDLALSYFSKKLLRRAYPFKVMHLELVQNNPQATLVLENANWRDALLLLGVLPHAHLLILRTQKRTFPWFRRLFYCLHLVPADKNFHALQETGKALISKGRIPCIFTPSKPSFLHLFKKEELLFAHFESSKEGRVLIFSTDPTP